VDDSGAITRAGMSAKDISDVLLVGGMTRVPAVQRLVQVHEQRGVSCCCGCGGAGVGIIPGMGC